MRLPFNFSIRVVVEGDDDYDLIGDYVEIGGDRVTGIPFEDYLEGWPG